MKKRFPLPRFLGLWLTVSLALPNPGFALRQEGVDDKQGKTRAGLEEALLGSQKPVQLASAVVPTAPSVVPALPAAGLEEAKGKIFRGFQGPVRRVTFTRDPEGQYLLAAAAGRKVTTFDWKAQGRRNGIDFGEPALAATFSSTQYGILVVTPSQVVRPDVHHPKYGKTQLSFTFQLPAAERLYPHSLAFSPDRKLLLVTGRELNEARVQNLEPEDKGNYEKTHGILAALRPKQGRPISGAFHPDGEVVALGTSLGTVELWRLPRLNRGETEAKLLVETEEHGGAVLVPFFSPDGKLLATGDANGNVRLWQWEGEKESLTLRRSFSVETHQPIYSISFLPVWDRGSQEKDLSSRVVAAAGKDGMIRFWDASSGKELSRMWVKPPSPILSISFSPDGEKIAAGRESSLALWKVPEKVAQWVAALPRPARIEEEPAEPAAGLEERQRITDLMLDRIFGAVHTEGGIRRVLRKNVQGFLEGGMERLFSGRPLKTYPAGVSQTAYVVVNQNGEIVEYLGEVLNLAEIRSRYPPAKSYYIGKLIREWKQDTWILRGSSKLPEPLGLSTGHEHAVSRLLRWTADLVNQVNRQLKSIKRNGVQATIRIDPSSEAGKRQARLTGMVMSRKPWLQSLRRWLRGRPVREFRRGWLKGRDVSQTLLERPGFRIVRETVSNPQGGLAIALRASMDMDSWVSPERLMGLFEVNGEQLRRGVTGTFMFTVDLGAPTPVTSNPYQVSQLVSHTFTGHFSLFGSRILIGTLVNPKQIEERFEPFLALLAYLMRDGAPLDPAAGLEEPDSRDAEGWRNLGDQRYSSGDLAGAAEAYEHVVEIEPENILALSQLGAIRYVSGDFKKAVQALKRVVEMNPESAKAWRWLGTAYYQSSDLTKAIEAFGRAVAISPRDAQAWRWLGSAQEAEGNLVKAVGAYGKAVGIDSNNAESWRLLGVAQYKLGNLSKARKAFEHVVRIEPSDARNLADLGAVQHAAGDISGARETYLKALGINPHYREVLDQLGAVRSELGDFNGAIASYIKAMELSRNRPNANTEAVEHAVSGAVRFLSEQSVLLSSLVGDQVMPVSTYLQGNPEIVELGRLHIEPYVVPSRPKVPSAVKIPATIRLLVQPRYKEGIQGQMAGVNVEMVTDPAQADFVIGDAVFVRNQRAKPSAAKTLLLQVDDPALVERITPLLLAHILNRRDLFPAGAVVRIGTLVKGDLGEGLLLFA